MATDVVNEENDVIEPEMPCFLQPLQNVVAVKDWSVQFECIVGGSPRPKIRWFYEGVDVTSSPRFQLANFENGKCVLRIDKVILGDGGRYACYISNEKGENSSTANLSIRSMAIAPRFETQLEGVRVSPGGDAVFTAIIFGTPTPIVAWYREGVQVHDSVNCQVRSFKEKQTLTLVGVREEDSGTVTCAIANQQGQTTSSAPLVVMEGALENVSDAEVVSYEANESKFASQSLSQEHHATKEVVDGNFHEMKSIMKKKEQQQQQEASMRSVRISPSVGIANIPPSPGIPQPSLFPDDFSQLSGEADKRHQISCSAPQVKSDREQLRVPLGQLTLMTCKISGDPVPEVTWYRGDQIVESNADFEVTYDGTTTHLIIRESYLDDSDLYTCTAANEHGTSSHSFTLQVYASNIKPRGDGRPPSNISTTDVSTTSYDGFESTDMEFVSESDVMASDDQGSQRPESQTRQGRPSSATPNGRPPCFEVTPDPVMTLVEGGRVQIDCVITGAPRPLVTWGRDNVTITGNHRTKITCDESKSLYSLVIEEAQYDDIGEYQISATNQFGFISGAVKVISEDQYRISQEETAVKEQVTHSRGRQERRSSSRGQSVQWSANTRESSNSPALTHITSLSTKEKSISTNQKLAYSGKNHQHDIEKSYLPRFLSKPDNIVCTEGNATRIDCKVTGRPMPEVTFFLKGTEVQEDYSHRLVIKEDGVRSLIISPAKLEDTGKYTIIAKNEAGKAYTSLNLTVVAKEGAEIPKILEKPQSLTAKEGDTIRLEVFAVGKPTPEIVWMRDNVLLHPEGNHDFLIDGVDGHGLLTIGDANKREHDAWYTATAVNKHGRDLARCKVTVKQEQKVSEEKGRRFTVKKSSSQKSKLEAGKSSERHKLDHYDDADMYNEKKKQKPKFRKKLESVRQKIYGSARFQCYVVPICDPNMKVEWLLDNKPLEHANRITTLFEFGYASLNFSSVFPRDTGVISCRVTNSFGIAQSSTSLIVKEEKGLVESTQLPETDQLHSINSIEKYRQKYSLAHDHPAELPKSQPLAPQVVLHLQNSTVREHDSAKFICRVNAYPEPKVEWFLNGQEISSSKRFRVWYDGMYNMEITDVREYDQGTVEIVVANELGFEKSSSKIEVVNQEDFRKLLHKSEVEVEKKYYINEDQGRRMVELQQIEQSEDLMKKMHLRKVERNEELQSKFSKLNDEDQLVRKLDTNSARVSERDRSYEMHLRETKRELLHHKSSQSHDHKLNAPWLHRANQIAPDYELNNVQVTPDMQAPIVVEGLRNSKIRAGNDASFYVKFDSDPLPKVTWIHNEDVLRLDGRITWSYPKRSVCELLIRNVCAEDAGAYSVKLMNPAGKAGSQAFLVVQETKEKPLLFSKNLRNRMATELDRSVMLECSSSAECSSVVWRVGDMVIENGDKYQTRVDDDTFYLRVSDVRCEDSGVYSCQIEDRKGRRAFTSAEVRVAARQKAIMEELQDSKADMGEMAVIQTTVSHNEVQGQWLINGQPVQKEDRFIEECFLNKRKLIITCVQPEDDGHVEFVYGKNISRCRLQVAAVNVAILQPLTNTTVYEGDTVKLKTKINKDVMGLWYHDDVFIKQSERFDRHIMVLDRREQILTITEAELNDSGSYTFRTGNAESTCQLTVRDFLITTHLKSIEVTESNSAIFECNVNRQAYTSGAWLYNDEPIQTIPGFSVGESEFSKFDIQTIGSKQVLVVRNVKPSDAGKYSFKGKNCSLRTNAELKVREVTLNNKLRDVTAHETNPVTLQVDVSESEVTAVWTKDDRIISKKSSIKVMKEGNCCKLFISSLNVDHQGEYKLTCGSKTTVCNLQVKGAGITRPLHDIDILENEGTTLECHLANDDVTGAWLKDGKQVKESQLVRIVESGRVRRLVMAEVTAKDGGNYAYRVGRTTTTAKVTVISPRFSLGLKNITVAEGSDAVFEAMLHQEEYPHVRWEKNEHVLQEDSRKFLISAGCGIHHLVVKDCRKSDEGIYSCFAGSTQTSARLFVEKVEITKKLHGSRRVVQSKDFEMTTETSKSSVTGRWMHNGTEVKSSQRTTITQRGAQHSLKVSGAKLSDAGEYTFKVGSKQTTAEVVVEEVKVTRGFTEMKVKETHATEFQVELSVEDSGVCTWMKDDQIVTPTSNIRISKEGKVRKLEIKSCGDSDAGLYKCQVLGGVDECAAQLCVSPVRFTSELPKSVKCDESTREVDIACEIDDDDVTITWKKDGKEIATTGGRYTTFMRGNCHVLRVREPRKVHSGVYTAVAGSKFTTCHLNVTSSHIDILKSMDDVEVLENEKTVLEFMISEADILAEWSHNGEIIDFGKDKRVKYEVDGTKHRLIISKTNFNDSGEYTFNVGGTEMKSFVYVQTPEEPSFSQEMRDCIVECGQEAHFSVRVNGKPVPDIKWSFNGSEIVEGEKYKTVRKDEQFTLVVTDICNQDIGKYTCEASNKSGSFRSSALLFTSAQSEEEKQESNGMEESKNEELVKVVKMSDDELVLEKEEVQINKIEEKEELVQITQPLQDFHTKKGQTARFNCEILGTNAKVQWRRNETEIKNGEKGYKVTRLGNKLQLEIAEVTEEDEGTYECIVSNSVNKTSSQANLKIEILPPKVLNPLQPLHVIEGSIIRLSCVIEGDQLSVRWFLNGEDITNRNQCGRLNDTGQCWLVIESSRMQDSGEIRCHASNTCGEAISSTDLKITEKLKLDKQKQGFVTQIERFESRTPYEIKVPVPLLQVEFSPTVVEKMRVDPENGETRLRVKFAACPDPQVTWYKDGEPIGPDHSGKVNMRRRFSYEVRDHEYTSCLVVSHLNESDVGKYECLASNKLGHVVSGTNVVAKGEDGRGGCGGNFLENYKFANLLDVAAAA